MSDYWSIVEPFLDSIKTWEGLDVFQETFDSVPRESALIYAAHFCQAEVCNGGFAQLFFNSTGVLTPEAVQAFREIGQPQVAALIDSAMNLLGTPYPRDWEERQASLSDLGERAFDALDEDFYALIGSESGGFQHAADTYVESVLRKQ